MTALLADATNLGLARMASSSKIFSHSKLIWVAEWHIRDETYQAGLACLVDAIYAQPFTKIWGDGDTSSSDGQFFRAGGHGEARADYNGKYGSEPGVKFYTHVSDRYAPFHTKVIAANASEAAHILDGLLHHESSLDARIADEARRSICSPLEYRLIAYLVLRRGRVVSQQELIENIYGDESRAPMRSKCWSAAFAARSAANGSKRAVALAI